MRMVAMGRPSTHMVKAILDDLAPLGAVEARAYFGGIAFVLDGRQFAMHLGDEFYLRVNDDTRQQFIDRDSEPFRYDTTNGERVVRAYYSAPSDVLADASLLLEWAERAVAAARK